MPREANILLDHLPEIYQTSDGDIQKLLSVFESLLLSGDNLSGGDEEDSWRLGLEQKIAAIPNLFNPKPNSTSAAFFNRTPSNFLPWLAQWVALGQLQLLTEEQRRTLIADIVPLYATRGTKSYLEKILASFFPGSYATIDEELPAMTIGQSKIGLDTRLGGDIPFFFLVKIQLPTEEKRSSELERIKENIRLVIDLAKPAHTAYQLEIEFVANSTGHTQLPENKYESLL